MNTILHDIIVFSIALTLPTYFVRGIDAAFKHYKEKWHLFQLRRGHRHCATCHKYYVWEYTATTCCPTCPECRSKPLVVDKEAFFKA